METFVNHNITHKKSAHVACNEVVLNHVFPDIHFQCTKTNVQLQIQRKSKHICLLRSNCNRMKPRDAPWPHSDNTDVLLSHWSRLIVIHMNKLFNLLDSRNHRCLDSQCLILSQSLANAKAVQNHWFVHFTVVWFFLSFPEILSGMNLQRQLLSSFTGLIKVQISRVFWNF